jgi:hypothetical protein
LRQSIFVSIASFSLLEWCWSVKKCYFRSWCLTGFRASCTWVHLHIWDLQRMSGCIRNIWYFGGMWRIRQWRRFMWVYRKHIDDNKLATWPALRNAAFEIRSVFEQFSIIPRYQGYVNSVLSS